MADISDTLAALSEEATNPREPSNAWDDFAFACAHAYRTGQLVPVPSVERVALQIIRADAEAVEDEMAPTSQNWAMHIAKAIIAAMQEGRDG